VFVLHVVAFLASYENGGDEQLWIIDRGSEVYDVDAPEKRQDRFVENDAVSWRHCKERVNERAIVRVPSFSITNAVILSLYRKGDFPLKLSVVCFFELLRRAEMISALCERVRIRWTEYRQKGADLHTRFIDLDVPSQLLPFFRAEGV